MILDPKNNEGMYRFSLLGCSRRLSALSLPRGMFLRKQIDSIICVFCMVPSTVSLVNCKYFFEKTTTKFLCKILFSLFVLCDHPAQTAGWSLQIKSNHFPS